MREGIGGITSRTRTVSPSSHPRPASGGATDFFLASALWHQQALRPPGGEDARCVQPISATQSNCVHPHLVCSRLALATFAAGTPRGVLGSTQQDRGTGRFTTSEDRFGGSSSRATPSSLPREVMNVGVFCPRRGCDRASDTPVATFGSRAFPAFAGAGRERRRPPRPPMMSPRERPRHVMIRDAFHRQGPFVGSGGHYSPGPATATPLSAMGQPLDDDLSPPWALRRSSPVIAVRPTRDDPFAPRERRAVSPPNAAKS
jgi:hypothetical protein